MVIGKQNFYVVYILVESAICMFSHDILYLVSYNYIVPIEVSKSIWTVAVLSLWLQSQGKALKEKCYRSSLPWLFGLRTYKRVLDVYGPVLRVYPIFTPVKLAHRRMKLDHRGASSGSSIPKNTCKFLCVCIIFESREFYRSKQFFKFDFPMYEAWNFH